MTNEFKLINFPALAQEYFETFSELKSTALNEQIEIARRAYDRKFNSILARLRSEMESSEMGSDGLEEEALEMVGEFDPQSVQLDIVKLANEARETVVPKFMESNRISQKLTWFVPQMMAYIASWKPVRGEDGKYSPAKTVVANVSGPKDMFAMGVLQMVKSSRTHFFKDAPKIAGNQQYKSPICPLVPIVLASFKKYNNINYMEWNLEEISHFENSDISALVGVKVPELSVSEILRIRNIAITPATGARANKPGNPATTATRNRLATTEIGHLPKLAQFMVMQTWAAHPQNRTQYCILDPEDWDKMPDPLVGTDVFVQMPVAEVKVVSFTKADAWETI